MPAEKTFRRQQKLAIANKSVRTHVRTRVVKARTEIAKDAKAPAAATAVSDALRALDKAASKGVVHPNNAARRKSRIMRRLNKSVAAS
jgi:small subunit ribosomal protein S20